MRVGVDPLEAGIPWGGTAEIFLKLSVQNPVLWCVLCKNALSDGCKSDVDKATDYIVRGVRGTKIQPWSVDRAHLKLPARLSRQLSTFNRNSNDRSSLKRLTEQDISVLAVKTTNQFQ